MGGSAEGMDREKGGMEDGGINAEAAILLLVSNHAVSTKINVHALNSYTLDSGQTPVMDALLCL